MKANNIKMMYEALTGIVNYLNKDVKRTSKCKRCFYRDKSFRSEPCYWHVDCGIDESDINASDDAMRLMKRFKLQKALDVPPRNCDVGTAEEQAERFEDFCLKHIGCAEETGGRHCVGCPLEKASMKTTQKCELYWAQMPYEKEANNEQK
jgi:hypothetical protein